ALGIEKWMGKAKEGIGSKGFMKRSKKGGFWTLKVAHATLELRAFWLYPDQVVRVRNIHNVRTQLPPLKPSNNILDRVAYATLRFCNSLNECQNWNFTFSG
ncbi:hypothetical protein PIB30_090584, partial [Stylosanthes scabra]|nr:hypothetical protein [Stylosanthes scabra]